MELRLHIDGKWTAEEFSQFFHSLQSLSYYWIADMEYRFAPPSARDISVGRLRKKNSELTVQRINFASPGFTDLAGFGAILSEIRQFLEFIVEKMTSSEDRKLEREEKRLAIIKSKIEIASLLAQTGVSQSVSKLIEADGVDNLIEAIQDGRLKRVEILKDNNE